MSNASDEFLEKIKGFMIGEEYLIAYSFPELVLTRLESFNYEVKESDCWTIAFQIAKVEEDMCNCCHITEIPKGLIRSAVDQVCGCFFMDRYGSGDLDISSLDLSGAVSSVSAGDTTVSFDNNVSDDAKFQNLISALMQAGKDRYPCYRKIKW